MHQSNRQKPTSKLPAVNLFRALLNLGLAVALALGALSPGAVPVARADQDESRADPALLQLAAEHPDDTFMVIVQREVKNKDLPGNSPEQEVEQKGGHVRKQLRMIESFSAELTGKEILKLAKRKKVRWISIDAPLISTSTTAVLGTIYTVTNTNNSGAGSLRQAITDANAHAGGDTINFNIPGAGVKTITPTSALPQITGQVILDASTQPGYAGTPLIRIHGASAGSSVDGLKFADGSDGSTMRGLMITKFSRDGIYVASGADGIKIAGNWIGTTGSGSTGVGNGDDGIEMQGSNATIGGTGTNDRNVITNNGDEGIDVKGSGVTGHLIQGNYVGLDPDGATGGGNVDVGLAILTGTGNTIGGTTTAARNVISKNYEGIEISTANNTIRGNYIGTDVTGTLNRGNRSGDGVQIQGTASNTIVSGNLIAYNALRGVAILAGTGHQVLGNAIYSNTNFGIDLATAGVTANNGTKNGALPNSDMDFPVITSASLSYCSLSVAGYVGSAANQSTFANARVEFFKAAADSSGYGEGQTFLSYLTSDANGNFSGNVSGIGFNAGDRLTATATDSNNNTSEFGLNFQVTTATGSCTPSPFASAVRANQLPSTLTGQGIGVAVVDSGISAHGDLQGRIVANNNQTSAPDANDNYVHGTHVAGIIGGNGTVSNGARMGVAPGVNLINVKVSNDVGNATTSDLIDSLQWINDNKAAYNIRIVNISLNSTVAESYHTSPLDAAVEILWFNGIVVVVAAGNNGTGSDPVTLYAPANDPFVITVGATDDYGTAGLSDDAMAVFSAYGTTEDSFAKPDLVAPGRNIISLLASTNSYGYVNHPAHRVDTSYFRMSGTSMSAPVVAGAVALLLQDEPGLTPDQVKYRLKATASTNWAGYDVAKAGAGYLDIYAAVNGTTTESANTNQVVSTLLTTGGGAVNSSVNWNSVNWNSVNWNSVNWNSVNWNSVNWNSVNWNSTVWDD